MGAHNAISHVIAHIEYLESSPATANSSDAHLPGTDDTPIICLHGIGGNSSSFMPQLAALSQHHRIISWTMPGYGKSTALTVTSFATLSQALAGFMDALHIKQAHLIGHSIGGMIAQELALTQPERVKSLVLLATTSAFGGRDDSFKEKFLAARLKPLNKGMSMTELAENFVPKLVGDSAEQHVIQAAIASMSAIPRGSYRAILECLVTFNRYQDIARLAVPVYLLAGEHDNTAPPATLSKMAEKIPGAKFHLITGVGHLINLEAAAQCNQILLDFYASAAFSAHSRRNTGKSVVGDS